MAHLHCPTPKLKLRPIPIQVIQECIPVGCVPSAAVAVCPGGGLPWGEGGLCPEVSARGEEGCLPRGDVWQTSPPCGQNDKRL